MAKSASLEGGGSAKWFTCITNELSQIVTFVLTCEEVESVEKLRPMCQGLMERFRRAEKPAPRILYVDWGCCGAQGPETAIETLFQPWVNDSGMVVRLDISDWIHRFDDALRTNSHSKCATFESALTEAVLENERQDLDLLIAAVRAGDAVAMETLSDEDVVQRYVSGEQLRRHVRRVTRGVKETLRLVQLALEEMKGLAGLDENGVSLFKSSVTIDELWARQQRHLECLQDPPGVSLYQVSGYTSINGVDVPFYTCLRERISLERFHRSLHRMIPGSQCAAQPYQVHLLGGIARWNADRTSEFLFGSEEQPQHSVPPLSSPLTTDRPATHQRCSAGVQCDDELLGLEYLLRERTGDSSVFSLVGLTGDILDEEEEEDAEEEEDDSEVDEAYLSDEKPLMDEMDVSRITLICSETTTAVIQPPALAKRTYDTATSTSLATITRSVPPAASHSSPPPSLQPKLHISALAPLLPNSHTPLLPLQSRRTTDTATFTITTNRPTAVLQTAAALSSVQPPMVVLTQPKTPDNTTTSTITRPIQSAAAAAAPSTVQLVMVPLVQRKSSDLSTITRPVPTAALQSIASSSAPLVLVSPVQPKTPDIATTITSPTAALQSAASPTRLAMVTHLQPNTTNIATTTKPVPTTASVHPKTRNTTTTITRPQLHSRPALPPLLPSSAAPPPPQPGPESGSGSGSSRALPPMLPQASWSRSTIYKRKQVGRPAELRAKQSRIKQPPTCKACGQLIQGHLKHKKKTFCPDKNISPSQGLDNRVYRNFEHFVSVVDGLED